MKTDIIIAICWLLQPILLIVGLIAWAGFGWKYSWAIFAIGFLVGLVYQLVRLFFKKP